MIYLGLIIGLSFSTSCAAFCTPIIVPYIAHTEKPSIIGGLYSSILFSCGRLSSYLTLGLLFGLLVTSVEINPTITALATLTLGFLLIIHGLSVLGVFRTKAVKDSYLCKCFGTNRSPIYLGILTGIRPCMPLMAVLTYSINLSGIIEVIVFILSFWLGSSILIFIIGLITGGLASAVAKNISVERIRRISGVTLIIVGLFFIAQTLGVIIYQI